MKMMWTWGRPQIFAATSQIGYQITQGRVSCRPLALPPRVSQGQWKPEPNQALCCFFPNNLHNIFSPIPLCRGKKKWENHVTFSHWSNKERTRSVKSWRIFLGKCSMMVSLLCCDRIIMVGSSGTTYTPYKKRVCWMIEVLMIYVGGPSLVM